VNAATRLWLNDVAEHGCIVCRLLELGRSAAELHHCRTGRGGAERGNDLHTIPLCPEHHRGPSGFHGLGMRAFERRYRVSEVDLHAQTMELFIERQFRQSRQSLPAALLRTTAAAAAAPRCEDLDPGEGGPEAA
jgi:hypothetical protein